MTKMEAWRQACRRDPQFRPCVMCGDVLPGPVVPTLAEVRGAMACICGGCLLMLATMSKTKKWRSVISQWEAAAEKKMAPTPLARIKRAQKAARAASPESR